MAKPQLPFVLRKHSMPLMAVFAEAVEWAISQPVIDVRPRRHIAVEGRERGGEKHLEALAALDGVKRIKEQAKTLRKLGFEVVEHDAALLIAELGNAGIFRGGGVLIGTRAFSSLLNHLGYKATPFLGTQDVDIARFNAIRLASPMPEGGFLQLLRQTGLPFTPVPGLERPPGPPTSYKVIGKDLKVDLLAPGRRSSKPYAMVAVPELAAHATPLPFLEYLIADSWMTIIIGRDHLIPVRCPQPARYCLHKLVVADLRSGIDNPKIEKDVAQAGILAAILTEEDPDALEQAASALTPAMIKHVKQVVPKLEMVLAGAYPAALELVRHSTRGPTPAT